MAIDKMPVGKWGLFTGSDLKLILKMNWKHLAALLSLGNDAAASHAQM